jgi:hypothetical protein
MQNLAFANFAAGAAETLEAERFQPDYSKLRGRQGNDEKFICKNLNYPLIDASYCNSTAERRPSNCCRKTVKVLIERRCPPAENTTVLSGYRDDGVMHALAHLEARGHQQNRHHPAR